MLRGSLIGLHWESETLKLRLSQRLGRHSLQIIRFGCVKALVVECAKIPQIQMVVLTIMQLRWACQCEINSFIKSRQHFMIAEHPFREIGLTHVD